MVPWALLLIFTRAWALEFVDDGMWVRTGEYEKTIHSPNDDDWKKDYVPTPPTCLNYTESDRDIDWREHLNPSSYYWSLRQGEKNFFMDQPDICRSTCAELNILPAPVHRALLRYFIVCPSTKEPAFLYLRRGENSSRTLIGECITNRTMGYDLDGSSGQIVEQFYYKYRVWAEKVSQTRQSDRALLDLQPKRRRIDYLEKGQTIIIEAGSFQMVRDLIGPEKYCPHCYKREQKEFVPFPLDYCIDGMVLKLRMLPYDDPFFDNVFHFRMDSLPGLGLTEAFSKRRYVSSTILIGINIKPTMLSFT